MNLILLFKNYIIKNKLYITIFFKVIASGIVWIYIYIKLYNFFIELYLNHQWVRSFCEIFLYAIQIPFWVWVYSIFYFIYFIYLFFFYIIKYWWLWFSIWLFFALKYLFYNE